MSKARFRNIGPDKSFVPLPFLTPSSTTKSPTTRQGDEKDKVRRIFAAVGPISRATGSALVEMGNLKVVCGVYGPRSTAALSTLDATRATVNCDFKLAPFASTKRRGYIKDGQEREFSMLLEQALLPALRTNLYPRSNIDISVLVLDCDGLHTALGAAITCASMALVNAGIEMRDVVVGCSAGFKGSDIYMDPRGDEEETLLEGTCLIAYMPSMNEITHVIETGTAAADTVVEIMDLCVDACSQIHSVVQNALLESIDQPRR